MRKIFSEVDEILVSMNNNEKFQKIENNVNQILTVIDKTKKILYHLDYIFSKINSFISVYKTIDIENVDVFTLERSIKWFKENQTGKSKIVAGIYLDKDTIKKNKIRIFLFFIDIDTFKPILDGSLPILIIETNEIKTDLKNLLEINNILLLK